MKNLTDSQKIEAIKDILIDIGAGHEEASIHGSDAVDALCAIFYLLCPLPLEVQI